MNWDFDLEAPDDEQEVFLLCLCDGERTIVMARRHVYPPNTTGPRAIEPITIVAWQSTWDGARVLHPFRPYAWAPLPDEKTLPVEPESWPDGPPVKRNSKAHIN